MQKIQVIGIANMGVAIVAYQMYRSYVKKNRNKYTRKTELKEHTHEGNAEYGTFNYQITMHKNIKKLHTESFDLQTISIMVHIYVMISFILIIISYRT